MLFRSDFTPSVIVGANAVLAAPQGMLGLGTLSDVNAQTTAQSDAYGLMTVSVAQASVEATVDPVISRATVPRRREARMMSGTLRLIADQPAEPRFRLNGRELDQQPRERC